MSAFMVASALTSFARWRWSSNGVFAPREVGNPPPAPSPLKKLRTFSDAIRRFPPTASGAVGRGFVCVKLTGAVGCTR